MQHDIPQVAAAADLKRFDGDRVVAVGVYCAVVRPIKGERRGAAAKDHAVLKLADDTDVYIEPLDSPRSRRKAAETRRFEGKRVHVHATAHVLMPSRGQGLVAPCLSDVTMIHEGEDR